MFGIMCNARKGHSSGISRLALVDRTRVRKIWWTSDDPGIARRFATPEAAELALRGITHNRPRVLPFSEIERILKDQRAAARDIELQRFHQEDMQHAEDPGWDAHKS